MKKRQINLKKNVSIAITIRILSMIMGFLTSIFITRYLGPELKGKLSYFMALAGTCWMILDLGFHKSLPYILAKDESKLNRTFTFSVLLHLFDLSVLILVVLFFRDFFYNRLEINSPNILILFVLFTAITHFGFIVKFIMLAIDRILWQNLLKLLPSVAYLLLFLFIRPFVPAGNKYLFVVTIMTFSLLILTYAYTFKLFRQESLKFDLKLKASEISQTYKAGIRAFLSSFIIFLLIRFDIFLIKQYEPLSELGIYALSANFVSILQTFSNLVGSLMLPKFSANSLDETGNVIILRRISLIFFFIMLGIAIFFTLFGRYLITLVYGQDFIQTYDVFLHLIPAVFFLSLGSMLNTYFWSKGFPVKTIILPLIALSINIILNVILIPIKGIIGAALATSISYGVWLLLLLLYFFNTSLVTEPQQIFWQKNDIAFLYSQFRKLLHRNRP